jgi:hypothetical protein
MRVAVRWSVRDLVAQPIRIGPQISASAAVITQHVGREAEDAVPSPAGTALRRSANRGRGGRNGQCRAGDMQRAGVPDDVDASVGDYAVNVGAIRPDRLPTGRRYGSSGPRAVALRDRGEPEPARTSPRIRSPPFASQPSCRTSDSFARQEDEEELRRLSIATPSSSMPRAWPSPPPASSRSSTASTHRPSWTRPANRRRNPSCASAALARTAVRAVEPNLEDDPDRGGLQLPPHAGHTSAGRR